MQPGLDAVTTAAHQLAHTWWAMNTTLTQIDEGEGDAQLADNVQDVFQACVDTLLEQGCLNDAFFLALSQELMFSHDQQFSPLTDEQRADLVALFHQHVLEAVQTQQTPTPDGGCVVDRLLTLPLVGTERQVRAFLEDGSALAKGLLATGGLGEAAKVAVLEVVPLAKAMEGLMSPQTLRGLLQEARQAWEQLPDCQIVLGHPLLDQDNDGRSKNDCFAFGADVDDHVQAFVVVMAFSLTADETTTSMEVPLMEPNQALFDTWVAQVQHMSEQAATRDSQAQDLRTIGFPTHWCQALVVATSGYLKGAMASMAKIPGQAGRPLARLRLVSREMGEDQDDQVHLYGYDDHNTLMGVVQMPQMVAGLLYDDLAHFWTQQGWEHDIYEDLAPQAATRAGGMRLH